MTQVRVPEMRLGFTGTRVGCTLQQRACLEVLLPESRPILILHGGAIGCDEEFHNLVRTYPRATLRSVPIQVWPSNLPDQQSKNLLDPYERMGEMPPLHRNGVIVSECNALVAVTKLHEEEQRSGTWATVRRARLLKKWVIFIWPDGSITMENQP